MSSKKKTQPNRVDIGEVFGVRVWFNRETRMFHADWRTQVGFRPDVKNIRARTYDSLVKKMSAAGASAKTSDPLKGRKVVVNTSTFDYEWTHGVLTGRVKPNGWPYSVEVDLGGEMKWVGSNRVFDGTAALAKKLINAHKAMNAADEKYDALRRDLTPVSKSMGGGG